MEFATTERNINIPIGKLELPAILVIPEGATAIVIFSHGSGSSRFSTRNTFVAQVLQKRGFATLLFDLLTEQEDQDRENRFDIDLLTSRLESVTEWITTNPETKGLEIGYFGASTGAASALNAAAIMDDTIRAVVSRGGRPDLADKMLPLIKAPTLLIIGSLDDQVIALNQKAMAQMNCPTEMQIIDGATHLFSEPGKLEKVAWMAVDWFQTHMASSTLKQLRDTY